MSQRCDICGERITQRNGTWEHAESAEQRSGDPDPNHGASPTARSVARQIDGYVRRGIRPDPAGGAR